MKRLLSRVIAVLMTAFAITIPQPAVAAQGDNYSIDDPLSSLRTKWWTDARFGLFLHWGVYSAFHGEYTRPDGSTCRDAEWIKRNCGIPDAAYAAKAAAWNPTSFDAEAIVKMAKDAGQKYIVITAKHHDGFSMWPTQVNDYNIRQRTPFQRDPLRELADAARANGLHFGLYYSIWDWHDPDALPGGNYPEYLKRVRAQLKELVTSYDPEILWFDGSHKNYTNPPNPYSFEDGAQMEHYTRGLKPGIIINERSIDHHGIGGEYHLYRPGDGDYATPEGYYPTAPSPSELMETCDNVGDTWGYTSWDTNFKSPATLIRDLVTSVSVGSNFLLNVGPTDTGAISSGHGNALAGMKSWMATNGSAIYGGGYSALTAGPSWGKITRKGSKLYLHAYSWPGAGGTLHVSALSPFTVSAARVLGSTQPVVVRAAGDGFDFVPGGDATNSIATVIEADITTSAPTAAGTGTGLKAEFWNNNSFSGTPAVIRTDATVNYLWRYGGSPDSSIGTDNFSSRWTGKIQPRLSETYKFATISDDTIKLWVNGHLIINNTTPHIPSTNEGSIDLAAGQVYDIKLEHTENGGEAAVKLMWSSPNTPLQMVPQQQLYPPGTANVALNKPASQSSTGYGAPATRAVDGNIDGAFASGSVTHTSETPLDTDPWWQVDLGTVQHVSAIKLWNRADCCSNRLRQFYVFASDTPFASTDPQATADQAGVWSTFHEAAPGATLSLPLDRTARYVRIQLVGSDRPLSLAEVQVLD
ncbi:alpha-L-fucosidase [Nonomuraea montanisoli]|uniref:alpha-L-fucosidase n=1 Tax=Nonomuraea montanisoli TaxID=2741721 RepID=UPI0019622B0C|nr:alpha-L-fucosidase [Nonomuraea montanisoli]